MLLRKRRCCKRFCSPTNRRRDVTRFIAPETRSSYTRGGHIFGDMVLSISGWFTYGPAGNQRRSQAPMSIHEGVTP
jgi:hypothetical protein